MTKSTNSQQAAADFKPLLLGCGLFISPRRPRGKCLECHATGTSRKTRRVCQCSADSTAPCTGGAHVAPGYKFATPTTTTTYQTFHVNKPGYQVKHRRWQ